MLNFLNNKLQYNQLCVHVFLSIILSHNLKCKTLNTTITFKQKSSPDVYGSWKDFLLSLPFVRLVTFRQSKNLSIIFTNLAVSLTSPLVSSRALATDSLRTYNVSQVDMYVHVSSILSIPEKWDLLAFLNMMLIAHVHILVLAAVWVPHSSAHCLFDKDPQYVSKISPSLYTKMLQVIQ